MNQKNVLNPSDKNENELIKKLSEKLKTIHTEIVN